MRSDEFQTPADCDPRLAPLLRARGAARDREIEQLIVEVARPVAAQILARYRRAWSALRHQDVDDIAATVDIRFLERLRAAGSEDDQPLQDLDRYAATLTYNAINDHMRRVFPVRARMKNRLRYVLQRDARFALHNENGALVAGLAMWPQGGTIHDSYVELRDADITPVMRDRTRMAEGLVQIFARIGRPVALDRLVDLLARLWQVTDLAPVAVSVDDAEDRSAAHWENVERRQTLAALWKEIVALRPMQRKALLLNLRGPETPKGVLLLVLARIATFDEVAAAVEMAPEELSAIWSDLPLDDQRIAAILGVTRQQVINLRKSARERLGRRVMR